MAKQSPTLQEIPLKMVGSTMFGHYPKISMEETFNMFISDGWMIPFPGYLQVATIDKGKGRGLFNSTRLGLLIVVISNSVYTYNSNGIFNKLANINSDSGDVFMAENDKSQIAICDQKDLYLYDYGVGTGTFTKVTLDFTPAYIEFQDGYFIAPESGKAKWRLSALNDGTSWPALNAGGFQTKSSNVKACVRFPGRGNQLFVMGDIVTEPWTDVGYQLFPFQRSSGYNVDYGCASSATIASGDTFIVWLGKNEKSGLSIMYSSGGDVTQISTDGINYKLARVTHPEISYGMLYKIDGHLIYHLTFHHPDDNFTYIYDFNTQKFFTLTDDKLNCHIARRVAYFNNDYYFVSFDDGSLYKMSSIYTDYNGYEIPRIRVTNTVRAPDSSNFVVAELLFPIEQGQYDYLSAIDLSVSRDSNDFSNAMRTDINVIPKKRNLFKLRSLGMANEFTPQFRFWGKGRFVFGDGIVRIYQ